MKTQFNRRAAGQAFDFGAPLTITLLLAALAASAQTTSFTATGWVNQVLAPGIFYPDAHGQALYRGGVHTVRVQASDPRVTGRVFGITDGSFNADGTANVQGPAYLQVGTWDAAGTNVTVTDGTWEWNWRGVMETNYSLQLNVVGYGVGGAIDGQRMELRLTRAPASGPIDFAVPYLYAGTIKLAPVNTTEVVDNFDGSHPEAWTWAGSGIQFPLLQSNHQLTLRGEWPGLVTHAYMDTLNWPYLWKNWRIADDQSLECRVDLVHMSENATNIAGLVLWSDSGNRNAHSCVLFKGCDFVEVAKWVGSGAAVLFHEQATIKNTNVVLSLLLTRMDPNVVVTARVLDKDNQEAVLYQRSIMDTPAVDPSLTSADLLSLSGMQLTVFPDNGPSITSGNAIMLAAAQYTDGNQPEMEVTYANLELRTSEIPPLSIERAMRLSWPVSTTIRYGLQWAPTVNGPWSSVPDQTLPGLSQITLPAKDLMRFFRLQQAP